LFSTFSGSLSPASPLALSGPGTRACAGLKLSKIVPQDVPLCLKPLFLSLAGCKNTTFYINGNKFFYLFFIIHHNFLIINLENFNQQYHFSQIRHIIILIKGMAVFSNRHPLQ